MTSCAVTVSLGAYVVGALDPAERAEIERHLADCAACRDELAGLVALPGLLGRLSADEAAAADPVAPDSTLLDRLLTAAARERRTARRRRILGAAAALVLVAGGTSAGFTLAGGGAAGRPAGTVAAPAGTTLHATDATTGVRASVTLSGRAWGTEIALRLSGVPAVERCWLVVHARDGHTETAGAWEASYAGTATVPGATAIAPADIASLDVLAGGGVRLVSVPVP